MKDAWRQDSMTDQELEKAAEEYFDSIWGLDVPPIKMYKAGYIAGHKSRGAELEPELLKARMNLKVAESQVKELRDALDVFVKFEDECIRKYGDNYLTENPPFKQVVDRARAVLEKWK